MINETVDVSREVTASFRPCVPHFFFLSSSTHLHRFSFLASFSLSFRSFPSSRRTRLTSSSPSLSHLRTTQLHFRSIFLIPFGPLLSFTSITIFRSPRAWLFRDEKGERRRVAFGSQTSFLSSFPSSPPSLFPPDHLSTFLPNSLLSFHPLSRVEQTYYVYTVSWKPFSSMRSTTGGER